MTRLTKGARKPLETFVQTVTGGSAGGLDVLEPVLAKEKNEKKGQVECGKEKRWSGTESAAGHTQARCLRL